MLYQHQLLFISCRLFCLQDANLHLTLAIVNVSWFINFIIVLQRIPWISLFPDRPWRVFFKTFTYKHCLSNRKPNKCPLHNKCPQPVADVLCHHLSRLQAKCFIKIIYVCSWFIEQNVLLFQEHLQFKQKNRIRIVRVELLIILSVKKKELSQRTFF